VNDELALCPHFASPGFRSLAIEPDDVLAWFDGPVDGVVRCGSCGAAALVVLLDWNRSTSERVFALAPLDPAAFDLFRRNRDRGSCDAGRLAAELQALWSSAGRAERLIALDVGSGAVVANVPDPAPAGLPTEAFPDRLPPEHHESWFERVGRAKRASVGGHTDE
jgi:hypothetical protein